jgi:hypothetical protein
MTARKRLLAAVLVEAVGVLGPGPPVEGYQGRERHHLAAPVADVELDDLLGPPPVLALGPDVHLPLAPEAVEVIHQQRAHEGVEGPVDLLEVDLLLEHLVAVDVGVPLGHVGDQRAVHAGQLRPLARGIQEAVDVAGQVVDGAAGAVLNMKLKPLAVPTPAMAGGGKAKARASAISPRRRLSESMMPYLTGRTRENPSSVRIAGRRAGAGSCRRVC